MSRLRRVLLVLATSVGGVVATLAATAAPAATEAGCPSGPGVQSAKTASYVITLRAGPPEEMHTSAEVKAKHLKTGEVMVGGQMMMGNMMDMSMRHLEAHICSRSTGRVVGNAHPVMTLVDLAAGGKPRAVPIAMMYGIEEGPSDMHYGNNVTMPAGHTFKVAVTVSGQRALFRLRRPA